MEKSALAQRLGILGLGPRESSCYAFLVSAGPSKASEVAAALGLNRSVAYALLQSMEDDGLVSIAFARPVKYQAEPIVKRVEERVKENFSSLESLLELHSHLSLVRRAPPDASGRTLLRPAFRVLQGREEAFVKADAMLRGARTGAIGLNTRPTSMSKVLRSGAWQTWAERASEGLDLRAIILPEPEPILAMKARWPETTKTLRTVQVPFSSQFLVTDARELLLWVTFGPREAELEEGKEEVALWSDAPALVATTQLAFESLWHRARDLFDG